MPPESHVFLFHSWAPAGSQPTVFMLRDSLVARASRWLACSTRQGLLARDAADATMQVVRSGGDGNGEVEQLVVLCVAPHVQITRRADRGRAVATTTDACYLRVIARAKRDCGHVHAGWDVNVRVGRQPQATEIASAPSKDRPYYVTEWK